MKQFLLPTRPDSEGRVVLDGRDFHYLVRVRRVRPGQILDCRTADGSLHAMEVIRTGTSDLVLQARAADTATDAALPPGLLEQPGLARLHLVQGMPKGRKLDTLVRQAMEAGTWSLHPVWMDHCVVQAHERQDTRVDRWERIAREAFQQSGSGHLMEIHSPCSLDDFLASKGPQLSSASSLGLFCHQVDLAQGTIHEYCSAGPTDVFIFIGPEGGFSRRETGLLETSGCKPVLLGPTILRTETAGIFSIAAVRMILWEAHTWQTKPR